MDSQATETISMWSHEVRNPVASMVLSAHALLNRVRSSSELSEIAERIVLAGNRAMVILESAMECSRADMPVEPMAAHQCLDDCVQTQSAYADARRVVLDLRLGRSVPATAQVDGRRFRHVVDNIVSNAIRFAARGHVRVVAAVSARRGELIVVIRDDGPGFEVLDWEKMAVRSPVGRGPLAGGWGIGLKFARQIAELMGGRIELANGPARAPGACVTVRVPLIFA